MGNGKLQLNVGALIVHGLVDFVLPRLCSLANDQEAVWARWHLENRQSLKDEIQGNAPGLDANYVDSVVDQLNEQKDHYPQYLRQANFLVSYAALESEVGEIAKSCIRTGLTSNVCPKRFRYLPDYWSYLCNSSELELFPEPPSWNLINKYRLVRNSIAHNGAGPDEEHKDYNDLKAFIDSRQDAILTVWGTLEYEIGWCPGFLSAAQTFANEIETALISAGASFKRRKK